eukprot:15430210-Alexandrium_andersonii.AAC.1
MSSAFRNPGRRPHARARPPVAKSDSSIRTASRGGGGREHRVVLPERDVLGDVPTAHVRILHVAL